MCRRKRARRARPKLLAEIEAALQAVESLDEDRILRHFVNAVQAALRTNFYQLDSDGTAEGADRDQVRQPQARRPAAAAAALRDLRLFAARRGRASALRQGRARRHPLVRPAAGFPHRDARPGQGAAGQERRHRAGRRQGRLRAEADCRPAAPARRCRRRAPRPTSSSSRRLLDLTDNLGDKEACIPPDNVVRHDDDDPYLVVAADKGTATFSDIANAIARGARLLARRRLRLRRLGRLRPQEDGHHRARRLGSGEAPFPRDGRRYRQDAVHRRRRRRHVGRRVRQRHAARGDDQAGRRLRPSRHLHRSRSRSGEELRRAQAPVRSAALELAGLRQGADLGGRRRLLAHAEGDHAVAARRRRRSASARPRRRRRRS